MKNKYDNNLPLVPTVFALDEINTIDEKGNTLLIYAIKEKKLDKVRDLLDKGANPNVSGPNSCPPLVQAAALNLVDITIVLLNHPDIDVNQHQNVQMTALYIAAASGYEEIIRHLLECNALKSIEVKDNGIWRSPLLMAIYNQHENIASLLIARFPECVNQPNEEGIYPLLIAVKNGFVKVVEQLLVQKTDAALQCNAPETPLTMALIKSEETIALMLINKHPWLVNQPNKKGHYPIEFAVFKNLHSLVEILASTTDSKICFKNGETPIWFALSENNELNALLLVEKHPEWVHIPHKQARSLLLIAFIKKMNNLVIQLIKNNAKLDFFGHTPLTLALYLNSENNELISLLIENCPELVNQPDEQGRYPLCYAVINERTDIIDQLTDNKSDPFLENPLITALSASNEKLANYLVEKFPKLINHPHSTGIYPLQLAVQLGLIAVCTELLDRGVDITCGGTYQNILNLATFMKHEALASMLIQQCQGLIYMPNEYGFFPLETAVNAGLINIVTELLNINAYISCYCNENPLIRAICNKEESISSLLMKTVPELVKIPSKYGYYPIHAAAQEGLINTFHELLRFGAKPDMPTSNTNCRTPLRYAALNGHTEIVSILLQKGVNYLNVGNKNAPIKPMNSALTYGNWKVVELLLTYPHDNYYLKDCLTEMTSYWMTTKVPEIRPNIYKCTELVKAKLDKSVDEKVLTLEDYTSFSWDACFQKLFGQFPQEQDKAPKDKNAAIRKAITGIYDLMLHPKKCLPYLHFLSEELDIQWKSEHDGKALPQFDEDTIELWPHQGRLWPIPKDQFQPIKKDSLLDRILLGKFKQYGMGETQSKWTGFVSKKDSKELLKNNGFFNENRRVVNGLMHGNVHNMQRVLILYAMEHGVIPLNYQAEDGSMNKVEPKEVFAALMSNTISLKKAPHIPLWNQVFDSGIDTELRLTLPFCLHSMILTNEHLAGTLQDYMRFSFCAQYNTMRDLFNKQCDTKHTNTSLCGELKKIQFETFVNQFEETFKIEKEKAQKSDLKLETDEKRWCILYKNRKPLTTIRDYGDTLKNDDTDSTMSLSNRF